VRNASRSMQEHVYIAKKSRIAKQSFCICLFVATHIVINFMVIPKFLQNGQAWAIVFINAFLGAITIPSLVLFLKYYKHSVGKKLIVTYNSLKYIDEKLNSVIELNNSEINKIKLVENRQGSRFPWIFHDYFSFTDIKGNKIVVTSYFMDLSEFWLDTLTSKVNSNKLVREERTYPLF
jgi:hypothetical protein